MSVAFIVSCLYLILKYIFPLFHYTSSTTVSCLARINRKPIKRKHKAQLQLGGWTFVVDPPNIEL